MQIVSRSLAEKSTKEKGKQETGKKTTYSERRCLEFIKPHKINMNYSILTILFLCSERTSSFQINSSPSIQWQYKPNSGGIASFSSQSPKRLSNNYASLSKRNALFFPSREQRFQNLSTKLNADADVESEKNEDTNKNGNKITRSIRMAVKKFKNRPGTYMLIPLVAAVVGWFTNWLAVQMLFYPIQYRGLPLLRWPEQPLGLIGWQGIVPCKSRVMGEAMVDMVTTELLSVEEVFKRLDPRKVADLLAPEVPKMGNSILADLFPGWVVSLPTSVFSGFNQKTKDIIAHWNHRFIADFTLEMQNNIGSLLNVKNCVVEQMLADRTLLGKVFRTCGRKELAFLTDSGLWFGFILGCIQMLVALFYDNPWSLSIGGLIVGLATNWLALKWIFEPVNPTKFGPFILQGQFMKRQAEVATEFGDFFTNSVLTSEKLWHSILNDPSTASNFKELFTKHFTQFANLVSGNLGIKPEPEVIAMASARAVEKLPKHLSVLHPYVDKTLGLQETIRVKMNALSAEKFERVLHPIFEEDELTLILAGAFLGFLAGLVQQGLETGTISFPSRKEMMEWIQNIPHRIKNVKTKVCSFSPKACIKETQCKISTFSPKETSRKIVIGTRSKISSCATCVKSIIRKKNKDDEENEIVEMSGDDTNNDVTPTK